jgi:hypothetical protein
MKTTHDPNAGQRALGPTARPLNPVLGEDDAEDLKEQGGMEANKHGIGPIQKEGLIQIIVRLALPTAAIVS